MDTLKTNNGAAIQDLASRLAVSHMTIRRDLESMAKQNIVKLIYGGVVLNPEQSSPGESQLYSLIDAENIHPEEKMEIGKKAASMLAYGDILIIDSGSTTEYAAKYLPDNMDLSILCYALNILLEIARKKTCKVLFAGGTFHENTLMFESPEGIALIKRMRARKAFVSAGGVDARLGVTCSNGYEGATKRAILNSSQEKILLVDSSKFGKISSDYFADLSEFTGVITDKGISDEYAGIIEDTGLDLTIV